MGISISIAAIMSIGAVILSHVLPRRVVCSSGSSLPARGLGASDVSGPEMGKLKWVS